MQKIVILSSGIGFGVYIPSLLISNQLLEHGIIAKVELIEKYFKEEKQKKLHENQEAFHKNIQVAKVAMRLPMMQHGDNYDETKLGLLLHEWEQQGFNKFIVLSGSWQSVLKRYKEQYLKSEILVYCIHMDCITAPSWKKFSLPIDCNRWLLGEENDVPKYSIMIDGKEPIPFEKREKQILVHGGGWGIGIDNNKVNMINHANYKINLITTINESVDMSQANQIYYTDGWQAWDSEKMEFPPLYTGADYENVNIINEHYVYQLAKNSIGIVSKAGGGTLLDSFSGAIPIIFTTSIAKHEEKNAEKWIRLGFGITYEQWEKSNFSEDLLRECYFNLINNRENAIDIINDITEWLYKNSDFKLASSGLYIDDEYSVISK